MAIQTNPAWTIDPRTPIGPQLYRILRERIIRADITPGTLISEAEIARTYALSRQPVREAFIKLTEQGLVQVRPQRGTLVRKISMAAVMDARFVREAIEADIVKMVATRADPAVVTELKKQIALQQKTEEKDGSGFMELDERFHRTLAEAAGKTYAWGVIEDIKAQMDRVRYLSFIRFPMRTLIAQHETVVNAIAAGDPQIADRAMRDHLREILSTLPDIAAAQPEFFEVSE